MFALILVVLGVALHGYLFWRLATFDFVRTHLALPVLLLWSCFALGVFYAHGEDQQLAGVLEQWTVGWLVTLFLADVALLGVDLVTGFGWWCHRKVGRWRLWALLVALLLSLTALWIGHLPPRLSEHEVVLKQLPAELDGKRLLFISDLHLGSVQGTAWFAEQVARIEQLAPDLILLGGDLFEGHGYLDEAIWPLFARLRAPLGVYAVTGNHEFHGDASRTIRLSQAAGVEWLHDRLVVLAPGLLLAGLDDLSVRLPDAPEQGALTKLVGGVSSQATLLLSHSPLQAQQAADLGVELMLSGHTHAGQVWPFSYLVELRYPWFEGRYQLGDMTLLVGRGTGSWGVRMRLWRPGEMLLITLRSPVPEGGLTPAAE